MSPGGKRNTGRPIEVPGGQRCSIVLGSKELRILAAAARTHLGTSNTTTRSRIIRHMIRTSWSDRRDDLKDIWQRDLAIADLQLQLEKERAARQRAEQEAMAARKRGKGRESVLERLLAQLPGVRERVASKSGAASGNPLLDQVWHNSGRSWGRVLVRLEAAETQQVWPPKEGPP